MRVCFHNILTNCFNCSWSLWIGNQNFKICGGHTWDGMSCKVVEDACLNVEDLETILLIIDRRILIMGEVFSNHFSISQDSFRMFISYLILAGVKQFNWYRGSLTGFKRFYCGNFVYTDTNSQLYKFKTCSQWSDMQKHEIDARHDIIFSDKTYKEWNFFNYSPIVRESMSPISQVWTWN